MPQTAGKIAMMRIKFIVNMEVLAVIRKKLVRPSFYSNIFFICSHEGVATFKIES